MERVGRSGPPNDLGRVADRPREALAPFAGFQVGGRLVELKVPIEESPKRF